MRVTGRARQQRGDVLGLERLDVGVGQREADVDEVDGAAGRRGRVDEVRHLVGAERDGQVRDHVVTTPCLRSLAGVDVDAAGDVDRHDRNAVQQADQPRRVTVEARAAADAHDPVDHHVGPPRRCVHEPAARRLQRVQPALVRALGEQHRLDAAAAPGQHRAGVQRVTAVVAASDQQQHPTPVRRPEEVDHRVREPGRRALHQRALGQRRHQLGLGRADLLDRVGVTHVVTVSGGGVGADSPADRRMWTLAAGVPAPNVRFHRLTGESVARRAQPSSTTTADAIPASCESDRWQEVTPSADARARTVPRIVINGRPEASDTTSASCHARLPGAPSAFAIASLAANRAASEAIPRPVSPA